MIIFTSCSRPGPVLQEGGAVSLGGFTTILVKGVLLVQLSLHSSSGPSGHLLIFPLEFKYGRVFGPKRDS